jgi:UPF0271 protein
VAADGRLLPRGTAGAVLDDPGMVAERVLRLVTEQCVRTQSGVDLSVRADTVCIHSDTPDAVQLLAQVRERLEAGGVRIRAC